MKISASVIRACILVGALAALGACGKKDEKTVQAIMSKAIPQATWDNSLTTTADITCDGQPDIVTVGHGEDGVWVGMIEKAKLTPEATPLIVHFPYGSEPGSFCGKPKRAEHSERVCTNEGGTLPGCTPIKGCQAVTMVVDNCDPFHFYWDGDRNSLTWWRR